MNHHPLTTPIALTLALLVGLFPIAPTPAQDDEEGERLALGRIAFDNACRMCHEPALVEQQRLNAAQWDAEIDKMIGWGARVAPEERPNLHAYLVAAFGPQNQPALQVLADPIPKPVAHHLVPPPPTASAQRGALLYAQHCANCHGPDARGGDPGQNLVDQESLLTPEPFAAIVANGRHRMPAFAEVITASASEDIRAWLLSLTGEPSPNP
ncbi:MAG: hypothetical protein KatS3mg108_1373 [Isosphaeraceae bacterium]|jgi:mono/diheme cytochrome c family protein|nr:MAG: hypothetical protein KatS3mg108_1373 [Isosphaeraceae bacterium]